VGCGKKTKKHFSCTYPLFEKVKNIFIATISVDMLLTVAKKV